MISPRLNMLYLDGLGTIRRGLRGDDRRRALGRSQKPHYVSDRGSSVRISFNSLVNTSETRFFRWEWPPAVCGKHTDVRSSSLKFETLIRFRLSLFTTPNAGA